MEKWNITVRLKIELGVGDDDVQETGKEYFEDVYNVDTEEQAIASMCNFEGARGLNIRESH